jgi:ABC-type nitrate/sulfonate/bicarbonate transport system permease component
MNNIKSFKKFTASKITLLLVLIYVVLFEFTWLTQSIFPKPSLLFESFLSLFSDYNLLNAFVETTSIVFPAILISVIVAEVSGKTILKVFLNFEGIINIKFPFRYFSFFFLVLLLNLLFHESFWVEFAFISLFVLGKLAANIFDNLDSISEEYVNSAKSLGLSENQIISKVIWKELQPKIYKNLTSIHAEVWVVVLIYEFVGALNGMGAIYRVAFNYNDLTAIISLGVFISILIFVVNSIIKIVISKLIFWK